MGAFSTFGSLRDMTVTRSRVFRSALAGALLAIAVLGLSACNRQPSGVPELQKMPVVVESEKVAKPAGFQMVESRSELYEGQLALILQFSDRIAGSQTFDSLLSVTGPKGEPVSGSWSLDDDGMQLRFPYVDANTHYTLRIKQALAAADGKTLPADIEKSVFTGPMEPAVGFASQGNVLPARETRGLPVVAVNVKEVDVEFLRVADSEVANFFAAYQRNAQRSNWELDPSYGWYGREGKPVAKISESVYANRFVLEGKENERTLSYLPIQNITELGKPGLYFAVMKRAGSFDDEHETAFFFVSDIGIHTRAYNDQLFVHAASLKSGEPLEGVELNIVDRKGNNVVNATTDESGNALIGWKLDAAYVLTAKSGKDVSLLAFNQPALDLSDFAVSGRKQQWFDVFAWSGRDLYRPGETVRLSALLRDYDGNAIKPQPLFVTLKQPDGRVYAQAKLDPQDLNYFDFSRTIPEDVPTGRWQVEFRLDPAAKEATQGMTFRIEEFLPERLKLDLSTTQDTLTPDQSLQLSVQGDYLYGAPASGNRFTARLTVAVEQHPLDVKKDFFFGDPTVTLSKEAKDVIDEKLDDKGHFEQAITVVEEKPTTPIAAIVSGSVYETGGRTVTRTIKRTVWPATALVGIRPLFDPKEGANSNASAAFEIIRANTKGELVASQPLKVTLVRERRDYNWVHDSENGWHFNYIERYEDSASDTVTLAAGKAGSYAAPVEWGNYRLDVLDPETGLTTRFPFYAGWSWNDDNRGSEARPDKVKLALDKPSYRAGDTLKVIITAPQPGPGVILVESDHLLYTQTFDARENSTIEIPVTEDWERHDVYLTALVFRGGSAVEKVTPARAVGEAFIPMNRVDRKVEVSITAPSMMKPENNLDAIVKAPALAGKKAYVTVSAVDVGILNITRFARPDPLAWFFGQRGLGVDAYDLYGRVIESFEGALARLRWGGDAALTALPQARRPTAKVLTVDLFSGAVQLDNKGEATVALKVPDFNGTVRVTAVVYSENHYGSTDVETIIRAPLVAEISTPRVLAPGDKSTITLDLQNFSGTDREFAVKVSGDKLFGVEDGERKLSLVDNAKTTLNFPLTALEGYGVGTITISASSGDDLRIERKFEVPLRAAWPSVLRSSSRSLTATAPISVDSSLLEGLIADSVSAQMSVTRLPPLPFSAALKGLLQYPYGCVEQTTSKAYGALLLDGKTADAMRVPGLDAATRKERVDGAIGRIASMQAGSGHYSMWGGDSSVVEFLTPYVTEFLLDARDDGFLVPEQTLQKSLKRLNDDLLSGGLPFYSYEQSDHLRFANQAWSAYVLARVNRAPLGTLRTLFDNERSKSLTALPLVQLGIALKLMGDAPRGEKAVAEAFAKKVDRPWYLGDYGSDLRDTSLMIALVKRFGMSKPEYEGRVFDLARGVSAEQRDADAQESRWGYRWNFLSTQEQIAIARLGKTLIDADNSDNAISGTLSIGGTTTQTEPSMLWSRSFNSNELRSGVSMTPDGEPPIYANMDVAGIPKTAPAEDRSKVWIQRNYYTLDGKPWTPAPLKEGEALIVGIRIEAKHAMPDALLVDLLPGGLEIENFNLTDAEQWADVVVAGITLNDRSNAADVVHEEFRDDRYVAALKLSQGQNAQLFYLVRAVSPGTFIVPPPQVSDMYKPEQRGIGRSVPETIQVVQP